MMFRAAKTADTVRSAQGFCAASACSENTGLILIMDAILASIFVLISICIRLFISNTVRSMTGFQPIDSPV